MKNFVPKAKNFILKFNEVEWMLLIVTRRNEIHQRILEEFVYILYNQLWLVWIFRIPILESIHFVLMAAFIQNTSKWMLSSLSKQSYFLLGIFSFKELPRKMYLHSSIIQSLLFIMFSSLALLFKNFFYWWNIKILISWK